MACGKNIVSANIQGLSQVLGDVGFKINLNDEEAFINAIYHAVENRNDRGIVARLILQSKKFDINSMVCSYYNLFDKLINDL